MYFRLALNLGFLCFGLLTAELVGICYHVQLEKLTPEQRSLFSILCSLDMPSATRTIYILSPQHLLLKHWSSPRTNLDLDLVTASPRRKIHPKHMPNNTAMNIGSKVCRSYRRKWEIDSYS